jgi:hypothetical protein
MAWSLETANEYPAWTVIFAPIASLMFFKSDEPASCLPSAQVANVGDSGLRVIRGGKIVMATAVQVGNT